LKTNYECDAHKRYFVFASMNESGQPGGLHKVGNHRALFHRFLTTLAPDSQIAVESVRNWYWMIDEMEEAGQNPLLIHAEKAKLMI